jgi:hypothetical protein
MSRYVTVYDRQGREIQMPSIRRTAREMGVSEFTIRARLRDGNWIHRDGYVPVRVRVR